MTSQCMGNDVARDTHCVITMYNDVTRDIHCNVTMSNEICYGITMLLFYYVLPCLFVLFYFGQYGIKNKISLYLISLAWRTHSLFLCRAISFILWTCELSLHKNNLCVSTD